MLGSSFRREKKSAFTAARTSTAEKVCVPKELYSDFFRLGLRPGASLTACKSAQRDLLKVHHPDRHAETYLSWKSATEIASSINASFQRISYWYKTGILD